MFLFEENYPEMSDSIRNLFSDASTSTKNHLVCVNYVPVTTIADNHTLYAMVSKQGGDPVRILLRKSYGSRAEAEGSFRKQYLQLDALKTQVQMAKNTAVVSSELLTLVNQVSAQIAEIVEIDMELTLYHLVTRISDLACALTTIVNETQDKSQQVDCCEKILKWIDEVCAVPEGIMDLLAYVEVRFDSEPIKVLHIEELSAINIITKKFSELEETATADMSSGRLTDVGIAYDQHMLFANYQLLSAFVSPSLSRKRFDIPMQETYWCLSEYVPIAMKFWHIYHPLLDYHPVLHRRIWDILAEKFSMVKTAECVTNLCGSNGHKLDVGDILFSAEDPDTEHIGHIFYGMCSDFNEIFSDGKAVPEAHQLFAYSVSPRREKWAPDNLIYTPHLAGAVMYKMLETAKELDSYSGKDNYYVLPAEGVTGILHFHESKGNVGSISDITTELSAPLNSSVQDRVVSLTVSELELSRAMLPSIGAQSIGFAEVSATIAYLSGALAKADMINIGSRWL